MTQNIPLIRTSNLLPFVGFLEQIGSPVDLLLSEFYLPKEQIFDLNAICTERQMWGFLERAARLEGIEDLGLLIARESHIEDLGLFGQLLLQSATLRDCLNAFVNFIALHHSDGRNRFWWVQHQQEVLFCTRNPYRHKVAGEFQALQYSILFMLKVLKAYLGDRWRPSRMYLQTLPSPIWERCELLANVELIFEQEYSAIAFPGYLLGVSRLNPILELPQSQFADWLESQAPQDFVESLQLVMRSLVGRGIFKIADISEVIGISPRTLQRRLGESQANFRAILNQTRYEIAMQKMADPTLTLEAIALDLGYASPSQFSRAFKLWTGQSPSQFRRNLRSGIARE